MDEQPFSIESCGITKSPLDAYRGRGIHARNEKSIKQKEQIAFYAMDIAGNNVPVPVSFLPTIQTVHKLSEAELEDLITKSRAISPCPCKSKECLADFETEKIKIMTIADYNKEKEKTVKFSDYKFPGGGNA